MKTPIMNWIHDRIYVRNQSCNILICGAVGTGKSFTALRIAELIQPDFDVKKQVVYTKEEFNALINEYKDNPNKEEVKGKVIIADEGGVIADSLDFQKQEVKDLKHNLQSIRYLNLVIIFCMPVHTQFLKAGRQLMHLYLETARPPSLSLRQTYVKPYVYKKSLFTKEGRELRKFTYKSQDGFTEEINIWKLHKPSRKLWQPYERFSQASKDRIANDSNTAVYESNVKKDVLGQLVLYLYTNKVMSIKQMAEACEVPQSRIRKYKDEAQDSLRKLHKLKVTAFQPY